MSNIAPSPAMNASSINRLETGSERQVGFVVSQKLAAAFALVLIHSVAAHGEIIGPYHPDEYTLHLWHMNESVAPAIDAVTNGTELGSLENGATLGNESYIDSKSFGSALGTYIGNPAVQPGGAGQDAYLSALPLQNGPGDNVALSYAGSSGAFTYEAIVRIDFDPAISFGSDGWGQGRNLFMQIICADADENPNRVFQFRLAPVGTSNGNTQPLLEFINLNKGNNVQSLTATIPTDGPDAIRAGSWYHLAVAYDGEADRKDNLRFYWTLLASSRTVANSIGAAQMTYSLSTECSPDFAIGQTGRQSPVTHAPNNSFVGLIDEVRISGVARSSSQMLFGETILVERSLTSETNPPAALVAVPAILIETNEVSVKPETVSQPVPATDAIIANVTVTASPILPSPVDVASTQREVAEPPTIVSGAVVRGPANKPRLAIMFSCRDSDEAAAVILGALKSHQAKASFFLSSDFLNWPVNKALAQSMLAQGHFVGPQSDSWTHFANAKPDRSDKSGKLYPDVEWHKKQLAVIGVERKDIRFFLPTSDQLNVATAERARDLGLTMVAGTPGTFSFATATVEGTQQFASSQVILDSILKVDRESSGLNGFLLLFQFESGAQRNDKFYARFDELIGTLRNCGYEFVRVDQLLDGNSTKWASQPSLVDLQHP